jgi:hypothetical protein
MSLGFDIPIRPQEYLFFTTRKLIVLDVVPQGHKYNQHYFMDYIFSDSKKANLGFHRRMPESTFPVRIDNSMCHNGSKVMSEFGKHHVCRFSHAPYLRDIGACDVWLFGMLKGILKDQEFNSTNETEETITRIWDGLTSDNTQGVFQNSMSRLAWVIENRGEHAHE